MDAGATDAAHLDAYCSSGQSPGARGPNPTKTPDPRTVAVTTGIATDPAHGAVVPPLYLSSNFTFAGYGDKRPYDYTRSGNPTRDLLAEALADLEGGAGAVVTASGMSAVTLALMLLEPGDRLIAPHDCYGGTYRLIQALARRGALEAEFVDLTDGVARAEALARGARVVWIETPIALGADVVLHSTTKYLNGHSDVVGGAVIAAQAELHERLAWWANCLGLTGAPFDSYLTLRGIRTLPVRMRQHEENAAAVVATLERHPAVARVYYPGRLGDPGHAVAARQQRGFGGMVSFELAGGSRAVQAFLQGLDLFQLAESLGGVESLVAHPATMTHASMDPEARRVAGIGDALLRLSVGIEAPEDLVRALERGLARADPARGRVP